SPRDTDREFPTAVHCACSKQRGQIRARCRKYQQGQQSHGVKRTANDVTSIGIKSWTDQSQRQTCIGSWILPRQLDRDRAQIFRCPLARHARLQTAEYSQRVAGPVLQMNPVEIVHDWYVVVRPVELFRAMKARRCHAYDGERIFVEPHCGPDYTWVGVKCSSPKLIAQDHIRR